MKRVPWKRTTKGAGVLFCALDFKEWQLDFKRVPSAGGGRKNVIPIEFLRATKPCALTLKWLEDFSPFVISSYPPILIFFISPNPKEKPIWSRPEKKKTRFNLSSFHVIWSRHLRRQEIFHSPGQFPQQLSSTFDRITFSPSHEVWGNIIIQGRIYSTLLVKWGFGDLNSSAEDC